MRQLRKKLVTSSECIKSTAFTDKSPFKSCKKERCKLQAEAGVQGIQTGDYMILTEKQPLNGESSELCMTTADVRHYSFQFLCRMICCSCGGLGGTKKWVCFFSSLFTFYHHA